MMMQMMTEKVRNGDRERERERTNEKKNINF